MKGKIFILQFSVLSSGSKGNSLYIETKNACVLIDAGLSKRELDSRLRIIGRSPEDLSAVFLTHEHSDHVRGAGQFSRRYGVPLYSTDGTRHAVQDFVGEVKDWQRIGSNQRIIVGDMEIESYPTSHDAAESIAYVIYYKKLKLGHATDLGLVTSEVIEKLTGSDVLLVEANHDEAMLDAGPYPWSVKRRIKSDYGHLSNRACAKMLSVLNHSGLQRVGLMHLSETNNHPDIAFLAIQQVLQSHSTEVFLARQDRPTKLIAIQ